MTPRRRRLSLLLAVLLGMPVLGAVASYVWINRVADQRWADVEVRIRQLSAVFPEGAGRRDLENVSESAKENQIHFVAAIRMAAPKRLAKFEAWKLISERKSGKEADALLDEAQEFLDRVHQGARRIAASPSDVPPRWHGDWDFVTLTYMMYCGVLRARQQRGQKAPLAAAETLLDSLHLARFWASSGNDGNRVYAFENVPATLDEFRDLLSSETWSPQELRGVERELESLDAALKSPLPDLEPALARFGESLVTRDWTDVLAWAPYRRKLFPDRLMKAEAFEFFDRQAQEVLAVQAGGYAQVRRRLSLSNEEAGQSYNPILRSWPGPADGLVWSELERKAQIRLLQVAAHYRATGEILEVTDPFGTSIRYSEAGTGMKFWSVGIDGVDDGGDKGYGRWLPPPPVAGFPALPGPKDLVIEVPRRP